MSDKQTIVEVELTAERLALTIAQQRIADLEARLAASEREVRVLQRALDNAVSVIRGEIVYSYMPTEAMDAKWLIAAAGANLREEEGSDEV